MEGQARIPVDLLISGGLIVTLDNAWTIIEDGALAVNGREIVVVGPSNELRVVLSVLHPDCALISSLPENEPVSAKTLRAGRRPR